MTKYLLIALSVIAVLWACSGTESPEVDTTPPQKPILIPHLGNAGDGLKPDVDGNMIEISDYNNGIDAESAGNTLRLMWKHLEDNDLDYIKIYRSNTYDTTKVVIDSISWTYESYVDQSLDDGGNTALGKEWFYWIEVFDRAGNSTRSDSVYYELIDKPNTYYPPNNAEVQASNFYFKWTNPDNINHVRVLLFDNNENLIWHRDVFQTLEDGDSVSYDGPQYLINGEWRVDAFVDGENYKGSESILKTIFIRN